jgi:hypothetical protein
MTLIIPMSSSRAAAARHACPFNRVDYVSGLTHLGQVELRPSAPAAILRRPISGSRHFDGLGPWPYMWIYGTRQVEDLYEAFRDLVTLTVITQPGHRPVCRDDDAVLFKEHFIFDPSLQLPEFSKRVRKQVRRGLEASEFDVVTDFKQRLDMASLYEELKSRRRLAGGFFDFPRVHFETVASLREAVFFRVRNSGRVDAMACGVVFGEWIQLLHIVISDAGLRGSASYALMFGLLEYAKTHRRWLCMGGIPRHGDEGLLRFKVRWSNRRAPVFLVRIVNDTSAYAKLIRGRTQSGYFPAYRVSSA